MAITELPASANKYLLPGLFFLLALYVYPTSVEAETSFSGHISTDTTWTQADSPYILTGEVIVDSGATLSIESGVTIKSGNSITIYGRLDARGTAEYPITFTSDRVDPVAGSWYGLWFMEGSEGVLAHFGVHYGGYHQYRTLTGHRGMGGGIYNTGGDLDISNCLFQNNNYFSIAQTAGSLRVNDCDLTESRYGVIVTGGDAAIADSNFINDWSGVYLTGEGNMILRRNRFDVDFEAIFFDAATVTSFAQEENIIDAAQYLGVIVGSPVSKNQTWNDGALPYIFKSGGWNIGVARMKLLGSSYLDVSVDTTLTLGPGTVVKNLTTSFRVIAGTIDAKGTKEKPVIFTSLKDDGDGRDTNNDGSSTSPVVGDWTGFTIGTTGALFLDHARVHFASVKDDRSGISNVGGTVRITNSEITHNGPDGIENHAGTMVINNSSIFGDQGYGVLNRDTEVVDARNNYWGDPSGPRHLSLNPSGLGSTVSDNVDFDPWLDAVPGSPPKCCSSVLFLPGIMGSELYEGGDKRWEPDGESDIERLYMDSEGKSVHQIEAGEVIRTFDGPSLFNINIYKSFLADLENKKQSGFIIDYDAYAYDWRLSLEDILADGDLIERLRALVATSKTGKVTIVAHSNGGLLVKALVNKLEEQGGSGAAALIDQLILVGVPQLGTPQAIGALLHGYDSGIKVRYSEARARDFAQNAPFAYQLLPYDSYSDNIGFSVSTPLVTFGDGVATQTFRESYGNEIYSGSKLRDFILGTDGRATPAYSDLVNPANGNNTLLQSASHQQSQISHLWQAPAGIKVHQIAGVGELTVAGIEYQTVNVCLSAVSVATGWYCNTGTKTLGYRPVRVVDGDATVVEPSALAMQAGENVQRWWVNLSEYNKILFGQVSKPILRTEHKDILEVADLRSLIFDNIIGTSTNYGYTYLSNTRLNLGTEKRLSFTLHSPLTLSYTESDGIVVNEHNPHGRHSRYTRYGEVQIIDIFDGETGEIQMLGEAAGSFTLELEQVEGNQVVNYTTYTAIPSSTSTIAVVEVLGNTVAETSDLIVDYDGDNITDFTLSPSEGEEVSLPTEPPAEPTLTEIIDQLITYIDINVTNKQVKKLLTQQLKNLKKTYRKQEELKAKLPQLANLFKQNTAIKVLINALEKQIDVYLKLKRLDQTTATEIKRLLKVIENKL